VAIRQPSQTRRGRGATFDPHNRFAAVVSETVDDGWWRDEVPERIATEVRDESAKSALSWNRSPDLGFDRSINPYRGCEHGCVYCYARPSHAFWDLSPGLDFETRLIARTGLLEQLRAELCKPAYQCRPINLSGNTDCYQPLEAQRGSTRALLELLRDSRHPVTIVTKSALILRDTALLADMARERLLHVFISVTTLDDELKRCLEPRTASPAARLRVIRELSAAGIPVGVLASPMIPGLNDRELEAILEASRDAGAVMANWMLLRLPLEVAPLFEDWLQAHYPQRAAKVMSLVRQCRGGADYDARFGHRMRGEGVFAQLLARRFQQASKRLGLNSRRYDELDCSRFRPPRAQGDLFASA
tara:strand:+ start:71 stop:1150 length:1080 start_codon:yes stop_codon:yes gene_type:complete